MRDFRESAARSWGALQSRLRGQRGSLLAWALSVSAILLACLLAIDALLEAPGGESGRRAAIEAVGAGAPDVGASMAPETDTPAELASARDVDPPGGHTPGGDTLGGDTLGDDTPAIDPAWQPQPMPADRRALGAALSERESAAAAALAKVREEAVPFRWESGAAAPPAPLRPHPGDLALLEGPADKRLSPPLRDSPPALAGEAPAWKRYAVATAPADGRPRIAVVLDDLGPAWRNSVRAIELPGPLTLALLPYAEGLPDLAARARAAGHELLVHMPMEPIDLARNNPGPGALLLELPLAEIDARLAANLAAFEGFVGINNHMGSAFSTYAPGLALVMGRLKERGLLFLDSRTIGGTLAEQMALTMGVPALGRDVFLDNSPDDPAAIRAQLRLVEQIALKRGQAVAIGHPHATTLEVLAQWLPELESRGFQLVPVSALAVDPGASAGLFAKARAAGE